MAFLIDTLILLLLAGTLGYAFLVDRRVRMLMDHLRDLQPVVGELSAAVDKSEDSVRNLSTVAQSIVESPAQMRSIAGSNRFVPGSGDVSFRSVRQARAARQQPAGVTRVVGKSDLVRGFFDTVRSREA